MDIYQQYKRNPLKFKSVLVLSVISYANFVKLRKEILSKLYGSHKLIYMTDMVTPNRFPMNVVCIPYLDRVYVYYEYIDNPNNLVL